MFKALRYVLPALLAFCLTSCNSLQATMTPLREPVTQVAPTEKASATSTLSSSASPPEITIAPTVTLPPVATGDNAWQVYQDPISGLSFLYPPDWKQSVAFSYPLSKSILKRIEVRHLNRPAGDNAEILIDIRQRYGDLLEWFQKKLRTGGLFLNPSSIEGGVESFTDYNAQLAGYPAIFVYDREHNSGTPDMAQVYVADDQYFYVFTYFGDIPDNLENRAAYLRILETVSLAHSTAQGLLLPETSFTKGVISWSPVPPPPTIVPRSATANERRFSKAKEH